MHEDIEFFGVAAGTRIACANSAIAIESLKPGDAIRTVDDGLCDNWALRKLGPTTIFNESSPVLFRTGAFNAKEDLIVTQNQQIMCAGWQVELLFSRKEVLVPASALLDGVNVLLLPNLRIDFYQLVFESPEIYFANGVACSSFGTKTPGKKPSGNDADLAGIGRNMLGKVADITPKFVRARPLLGRMDGELLRPGQIPENVGHGPNRTN
jgi:hypothetical protein